MKARNGAAQPPVPADRASTGSRLFPAFTLMARGHRKIIKSCHSQ